MKVATANLGRGVRPEEFRRNVRLLERELRGALIGFQEIDEADTPDEHRIIAQEMGDRWDFAGWATKTPLAVPLRTWRIRADHTVYASPGVVKQTPLRRFVVAELEHRQRRRLPRIAVVVGHAPRNVSTLADERAQWQAALEQAVAELVADDLTTLAVMDRNARRLPEVHQRQEIAAHKGVDYVLAVPAKRGAQVDVLTRGQVGLTIDAHDALWARIRLSRPKESR